jgi:hypothetical protein
MTPVYAKIPTGIKCNYCHTMHNSQDDQSMWQGGASVDTSALLRNNCLGCHTGTNPAADGTPYVFDTTQPAYTAPAGTGGNTLAGGNFYWVQSDDSYGHNVKSIGAAFQSSPPGWKSGFDANGQVGTIEDAATQLTCAGEFGCHGTHGEDENNLAGVTRAHHANDSTITGTSVGKSYRFLNGILGLEDSDWEYQPTASAHNQYKGIDRTSDEASASDATKTVSYLCAECHGLFHSGTAAGEGVDEGAFGSPWFRHPVDFDMGNVKTKADFAGYGGAGTYQVVAPVASSDVSSVKSTVYSGDDAIITCISCHRAHGTPYYALLRWDYKEWPGGTDSDGCGYCHTTKN